MAVHSLHRVGAYTAHCRVALHQRKYRFPGNCDVDRNGTRLCVRTSQHFQAVSRQAECAIDRPPSAARTRTRGLHKRAGAATHDKRGNVMSDQHDWTGASGKSYGYAVHELSWRPEADQDGNYIFAKKVGGIWLAVYIGQGDLQERYDDAMEEGCVTGKSATHYHEHLQSSRQARLDEEKDLIDGNPECHGEKCGCNGYEP